MLGSVSRELRHVGTLDPAAVARLASATQLDTLEDIIHWGLAQSPPWMIVDVVVQDEYTHDAVVGGPGAVTLCFDTT
jgi:hypothetical protein